MNLKITDVRVDAGDSAFLIDDGKTAILYDSGFAFTGFDVANKIKALLNGRELNYIFLTHSHYDHALGSVYALKYWPNAKVVASEYAAKIFEKDTAKAVMRDLDKKYALKCGVEKYEDLIDDLRVDIKVNDNDFIKAGEMEFICISLPGHTKCSFGFYNKKEKILLSCETIGVFDGKNTVVPSYLVGTEMTFNSISRVKELDIENILLPHFGLLNKEQTKIYLKEAEKSAKETFNEIANILKSGKTKDDAIKFFLDKFYKDEIIKIYPKDAIELNTNIMVNLIEREIFNWGLKWEIINKNLKNVLHLLKRY